MRPEIPVICADREPPQSVRTYSAQIGAELQVLGEDFDIRPVQGMLELRTNGSTILVPEPSMAGVHQSENLAAALVAVNQLVPAMPAAVNHWSDPIAGLRLPGRLASSRSDHRFIVDVGHNPMAAQAVSAWLDQLPDRDGELYCVLGMLGEKAAEDVARILGHQVDHWLCSGLEGARGQTGVALAGRVSRQLPSASVAAFTSVNEAVEHAQDRASEVDVVLVFGSFETAAEALRTLS
jgi:dihydrofolate synthase/folylpolyglutamate synthase